MKNIQVNAEKNLSSDAGQVSASRAGKASTARPWKWETGSRTIRSKRENYWLATMDSWDGAVNNEANAEYIVKAVNAHDMLVETLRQIAGHKCAGKQSLAASKAIAALEAINA